MAAKTRTTGRPMTSSMWAASAVAPSTLWAPSRRTSGRRRTVSRRPSQRVSRTALRTLGLVERPPDPRQDLRGGDGDRRVRALVAAGQGGGEGIAAIPARVDKPVPAARPPGLERPSRPEDLGHGSVSLAGDPADLPEGLPSPDAADDRNAGLDDARFLEGDLPESRSEVLLVVFGDRGDDRDEGTDDVGRVEAAAHPDLEDRDVDLALGELEKGQGGQDLEVGRMVEELPFGHEPVDHGLQPLDELAEALRTDARPVDPDPLLDPDEVGRRVEPGLQAVLPKDPVEHGRDRPLAVRPGHVNGQEVRSAGCPGRRKGWRYSRGRA